MWNFLQYSLIMTLKYGILSQSTAVFPQAVENVVNTRSSMGKKIYRHIPWNRYNLEKYRDINFWSYRPALLHSILDGLEPCGLLWCFYQLNLILMAPIHCREATGEQVKQCYISANLFWCRNKPIYKQNGLRVHFQQIFFFLVNLFFNVQWLIN